MHLLRFDIYSLSHCVFYAVMPLYGVTYLFFTGKESGSKVSSYRNIKSKQEKPFPLFVQPTKKPSPDPQQPASLNPQQPSGKLKVKEINNLFVTVFNMVPSLNKQWENPSAILI